MLFRRRPNSAHMACLGSRFDERDSSHRDKRPDGPAQFSEAAWRRGSGAGGRTNGYARGFRRRSGARRADRRCPARQFGQIFDDASRTIHMPKASEPTVSAATAQTTEQAIDRYATIVARGGWPQVPSVSVLRLGDRHPSVAPLRARLVASGDIDPNAVGNDIYDSYVEAAVRRFQARHGLTVDGVIRAETLAALNVPAPVRLAQLKVNVTRLRALERQSQPALRGLQHSGGAHRGDRERRRGVAPHRGRRQARSAVARDQQQDHPDQLQSVLDGAAFDRAKGSDPENAGSAGLPHQAITSAFSTAATASSQPSQINWYSEDATHYSFKQDPGSLQFARLDPHQFSPIRRSPARSSSSSAVSVIRSNSSPPRTSSRGRCSRRRAR
jgi:hypothetical protein